MNSECLSGLFFFEDHANFYWCHLWRLLPELFPLWLNLDKQKQYQIEDINGDYFDHP